MKKVFQIINKLHDEIKQHEMEKNEFLGNLELKDSENQKVNAELKRLRVVNC